MGYFSSHRWCKERYCTGCGGEGIIRRIDTHDQTARTVDIGHGRIEQRNITTSEALVGYSDWPGLAQVFELGRHVMDQLCGEVNYVARRA